jgi:tetratricopeptide (TPR) repeat protein
VVKKHKFPAARLSPAEIGTRIRRAEAEGRFQQALELAKSLYKQEPTPPHKELLLGAVLGRARQLRSAGHTRDAASTLENAIHLDVGRQWREQVAAELAACGQASKALELLRSFPDSPGLAGVLAHAADAALAQGKACRDTLPEGLRGQFDLVIQAFAQAEAGRDDEARAALQGIGLQSPFLEWKVLLRGLLAYYQGDDVRAVENWQRLAADRLPARVAAPLRLAIDPAFQAAQPAMTQTSLRQQADRLQHSGLVQPLRALQAALANERQLPQAFRQAENLLPALRQQAPHLVPRLAGCFYWTVITNGRPEDVNRYQRVFGTPADDPQFYRLQALALERREQFADAHRAWQDFEKEVERTPAAWPGDQVKRVRALIWYHMGLNAAALPDAKDLREMPSFLRDFPGRPEPLKPPANKCFERSLELAPDQLETYKALFDYLCEKKKVPQAVKTAQRLLERFPEHVPTLEGLGELYVKQKNFSQALELFRRALAGNPLERRLRSKLSNAHLLIARQHAEAGQFDMARAEYQAASALEEGRKDPSLLCKWAACEFKAGNTERAEALVQEAGSGDGSRLAVAYCMLIETIRLKLARPLKSRFDADFKTALGEPPTPEAAAAVAQTAAMHRAADVNYVGQKTHEKKITGYLEKALKCDLTKEQLLLVCAGFSVLAARRAELRSIRLGQQKFPQAPEFYLGEADYHMRQGRRSCPVWQVRPLLERAQELAAAQPPDQRKVILEAVKERQEVLAALDPFSGMPPGDMLGDLFGDGFDEDEDEDDEDYF